MHTDSEKIDAVLNMVTRLDEAVSGRGGVLDRLERVEATTDYHRTLLWRGIGVMVGISAVLSFLSSKLGAALANFKPS